MLHCLVNLFILKAIQINLGNFFRTVSQRTADNRGCNPSSSEDCRVTVPCRVQQNSQSKRLWIGKDKM